MGGKKKTLKEQLRENKREINRAVRELDRERTNLQMQEKKLILEIKKMAKENQIQSVKIMAKDLVRTRTHINKFYTMRSQLQAVSLRLETAKSAEAMTSALQNTTKVINLLMLVRMIHKLNLILIFSLGNEVDGQHYELTKIKPNHDGIHQRKRENGNATRNAGRYY